MFVVSAVYLSHTFLFLRVFLEQFKVHSRIEEEIQRIPILSLPLNMHSLPCYQHPQKCNKRVVHLLILMNLHWHIIITQSLQYTLSIHYSIHTYLYVSGQIYIMTHIYHYNIIQSIFTALKILYPPPIRPSYPWQLLISFTVSIVLPFPECHIVEIKQCGAFSDWFLPLSNIYLIFLHVFSWLDSSFLFSTE